MAIAGMPNSAAFVTSWSIRAAPSSSENSVWVWRWTKLGPMRSLIFRGGKPVENHILVIPAVAMVPSGRRAVQPPRWRNMMRLSYSSLSTYERCPAAFKFQYEDRLPGTTSPAMAFGDTLHRTLHRFHDRPVPEAPALADLLEMLEGEWVGGAYRDPGEES